MGAPWLHETREWKGKWWIPNDPENTHSGILTYSPETGLELVLIGGFIDAARKQIGPNTWTMESSKLEFPVIHGVAGGKRITLFDTYPKHTSIRGVDVFGGPSEQTIRASTALVGLHAESSGAECFVRADVAVEDLEGWSATYAIARGISFDTERTRPDGTGTVKLELPDDLEALLGSAKVVLTHHQLLPTVDYMRRGSRGRVEHTPVLKIETETTVCLETLVEYVSVLQDLLALASGRECAVLWMNVFEPRPNPEEPPSVNNYANEVAVYRTHRTIGNPLEKATEASAFLFTLNDVGFSKVVTAWWQVRKKFRASCSIIVGELYEPGGFLELKLITSVVAAESFHAALKEKPLVSKKDALARLNAAREVLSDEEWNWLTSLVPGGFSLRDRLLGLSRRLPDDVRQLLLPDEEEWASKTRKARNDLSHSARTSITPHVLYAIVRVTRAVVVMNILLELGISEERLVEALRDHRGLSRACELAQEHFPHREDSAG